MTLSVVESTNK